MRVGTYAENQLEAYARRRRKAYRGETHANAKQTRKSVALIKDLSVHGISQEDIAALLGVSQSSISKIIRGESYASTV
jgi:transcriptional regulator with XRE-family HTH domain